MPWRLRAVLVQHYGDGFEYLEERRIEPDDAPTRDRKVVGGSVRVDVGRHVLQALRIAELARRGRSGAGTAFGSSRPDICSFISFIAGV